MATKVTAGKVVSATVRYSNTGNSARAWDITADVNVNNEKVTSFNSGEVKRKDSTDGMSIANFNASGSGISYFNISYSNATKEEAKEILTDVIDFMGDVEESIKSAAE